MRRLIATAIAGASARRVATLVVAALAACVPTDGTDSDGVRKVDILLEADTLRPGQQLLARAVATGRNGEVVDAVVSWRSLTPSTLAVSPTGQLFALAPGVGIVRAAVGSVQRERRIELVNPPVATFFVEPESLLMSLPGEALAPAIIPLDAFGEPVVGVPLQFATAAARIATVSGTGTVTPVAVGRTTLRVSYESAAVELPVIVAPAGGLFAPRIDAVTPATIGIGVPFTLRGLRLAAPGGATAVAVDGRAAQLLSVSDTLVTAILPAAAAGCEPSADVAVQVATASGVAAAGLRLELAPRRTLLPRQSLLLANAGDASCVELPGDGRYVVNVLHAARALGADNVAVTVDLLGGNGSSPPTVLAHTPPATRSGDPSALAHLDLLARSRAYAPSPAPSGFAALQVPPVGGIANIRVPDLDDPRLCVAYRSIGARTVYSGTRIAILEDTATVQGLTATLAGQMDALITELGVEAESRILPLVERFGNPLVMDDRLDANGKIVLVLSPALNAMRGGAVMGAVVTCDFFPRASTPASNVGEMLYLQVPDLRRQPDAQRARETWRAEVRGTVAHELKHVVSFAERIARGQPLEEVWLEEATARHAEELFTRALLGLPSNGDAGYAPLRCEALAMLGDGSCAGTPVLMRRNFDGLYRFLSAPALRSPLGGMNTADDSFYGSGWSLLRWAMDHAVLDESAFARALTVNGQSGVANLEARSGRSWDELLLRWSLALITDGRSTLGTPADASLRYPSWDLADIFAGFCADLGACGSDFDPSSAFDREHPLLPLRVDADASVNFTALAPAGFGTLDLGARGADQTWLIRLRNGTGGALPPTLRLAILRVE